MLEAVTVLTAIHMMTAPADTVDLFVMSECPYGVAAEVAALDAIGRLGETVVLRVEYIGSVSTDDDLPLWRVPKTSPSIDDFDSLHGATEVLENARQIAVSMYWPDRWTDYLRTRAQSFDDPDAWVDAAEAAGIPSATLNETATSPNVLRRLRDSFLRAERLGIRASPTLLVNGEPYDGPFRTLAITGALCDRSFNATCDGVPRCSDAADCERTGYLARCVSDSLSPARCEWKPLPTVRVTVVTDARCKVCDPEYLLAHAREVFGDVEVVRLEATGDEGRRFLAETGLTTVPVIAFDATALVSPAWSRVAPALIQRGEYFVFDPRNLDAVYHPFRESAVDRVDVFIGGRHRESLRAVGAIRRLIERSGKPIDVFVRFVVEQDPDMPWVNAIDVSAAGAQDDRRRAPRFTSPRGQAEIDEDARMICLRDAATDVFNVYLAALYDDIRSSDQLPEPWTTLSSVASQTVLAEIDACSRGVASANALLRDSAFVDQLRIPMTPSFLVNNRLRLSGLQYGTLVTLIDELDLNVRVSRGEDVR